MGCAHSTKSRDDADLDQARHSAVGGPPRPQSQAASKEARTDELIAADEARLAEPKGSRWHDFGGAELEPLLAFTDVIDAAWLLKLLDGEVMPECKGVVPPWQLVPPEAKLSLETLRRTTMDGLLPVAVLSYGWEGRRHPDPNGALLRRLRPVLEAMVHSCEHGPDQNKKDPDMKPAAWGIVWECAPPPPPHAPLAHPVDAHAPRRRRHTHARAALDRSSRCCPRMLVRVRLAASCRCRSAATRRDTWTTSAMPTAT